MLLHWTHRFLRVGCSPAQFFILCNGQLSLVLLSLKHHLLSWLQAQQVVLWGLVLCQSVRNCSTSYSSAVILPYCLVYQNHLRWCVAEKWFPTCPEQGTALDSGVGAQHGTSNLGSHNLLPVLLLQRGHQLPGTAHQPRNKALFASPRVCPVDPISFPMQLPTALHNVLCLIT